jgi:hypothetical protein
MAVIRHPKPRKSAFWKTLLLCGYFADVVTDVDGKHKDRPTYPTFEGPEEMRTERADLDRWHKRGLGRHGPDARRRCPPAPQRSSSRRPTCSLLPFGRRRMLSNGMAELLDTMATTQ